MPRVVAVANSFTSGELAPSAFGRADLAKWNAGLTCGRNFLTAPLGGVIRRPGTRFIAEVKYSQLATRLIDFQPTDTSSYIIETGCGYLRFYKNSAVIGGPELLSNNTFDSSINNWTGTGTWDSNAGGRGRIDASGGQSLNQNATVVAGVTYTVRFSIFNDSARVVLGSSGVLSDIYDGTLSTGTYALTAVSSTTTLRVGFIKTSGTTAYIDDVSVRQSAPVEVTTPYDYGQVFTIGTVQSADEQYWLQACTPSRKLQRYGDDCWRFNCVTWSPPPAVEYGARPQSDFSIASVTGQNVTATGFNNGCSFMLADVNREIQVVSGPNAGARAGIKTVLDGQRAVVNICVAFQTTGINCAGTWKLSRSPQTTITPTDDGPPGKSSTLTLTLAGWRQGGTVAGETDVGKFVSLNGGLYEITCVNSNTVAYSIVRSQATSATAKGEAGGWSLEEPLWSCVRGYASAGDFKDDRFYLNAGYRFVGSKVSDYENHASGVNDDDAVIFGINSKTVNAIRHIVGGRNLQMFTVGGEFVARGGTETPITPSNVQVSAETKVGISTVAPIQANEATVFVSRFGRHLHEFTIPKDQVTEQYAAPDLLLLAEHLTLTSGIRALAFQREPSPTIWAVRNDGIALAGAYRRDENVMAWTSHETCGLFESVAVIPHPDGDREQVWFIVNRTIGGSTKRYVEVLDDSTLYYDRRLTDASVTYSGGSTCSVMQGVSHLNGMTVQVQADGLYVGTCVVANGLVGLATPATKIEVGLPYTSEAITLPPEISIGGQSLQPMRKRWSSLFARTKDSCGIAWRTSASRYTCLPTGNLIGPGVRDHEDKGQRGDFHDARIWFKQDNPLPAHVLMVGGVLDAGDA